MSFSTLTSDAINATFSSIEHAADVKSVDLLAGAALSSSVFGWVRAVLISLPQLMQVIFSPRRTWTPPHFWHGSLVSVPPFARREAPVLILLILSSEEAMLEYLRQTNFFFTLARSK
jgi:hypothetical protein